MGVNPKMPNSIARARQLRKQPTDAEQALWNLLRGRQLSGYKFRRQAPIGKYIVDFLCYRPGLVIELDGGQHQQQVNYDNRRTRWLESQGYPVIRFWSNQALAEPDALLEAILMALKKLEGGDSFLT